MFRGVGRSSAHTFLALSGRMWYVSGGLAILRRGLVWRRCMRANILFAVSGRRLVCVCSHTCTGRFLHGSERHVGVDTLDGKVSGGTSSSLIPHTPSTRRQRVGIYPSGGATDLSWVRVCVSGENCCQSLREVRGGWRLFMSACGLRPGVCRNLGRGRVSPIAPRSGRGASSVFPGSSSACNQICVRASVAAPGRPLVHNSSLGVTHQARRYRPGVFRRVGLRRVASLEALAARSRASPALRNARTTRVVPMRAGGDLRARKSMIGCWSIFEGSRTSVACATCAGNAGHARADKRQRRRLRRAGALFLGVAPHGL